MQSGYKEFRINRISDVTFLDFFNVTKGFPFQFLEYLVDTKSFEAKQSAIFIFLKHFLGNLIFNHRFS